MKKRILSILLAACLPVGLLPTVAFAEGGTVESAHTHCVCGGNTNVGDHTSHTNVTYQPWDGTSPIDYGEDKTAYVCLTNDVTIQSDLEITDGKTLYLCLNGKTFASDGTTKIVVSNYSHLILCDCAGGGTIKGADSYSGVTGIYLYHSSTMDMYGGKITNFETTGDGGAITLDDITCVFNMYGGEISGNSAGGNGGAIYLHYGGTLNISGGTISNNRSIRGGAINLNDGGTMTMTGGEISNNTAINGGAVYRKYSGW